MPLLSLLHTVWVTFFASPPPPSSSEKSEGSTGIDVTLENCDRYVVIDAVMRDRVVIPAKRFFKRRTPQEVAVAAFKEFQGDFADHRYTATITHCFSEQWWAVTVTEYMPHPYIAGQWTYEQEALMWVRAWTPDQTGLE